MRINTPNLVDDAEFVVLAPSGGFKLRFQKVPSEITVPDDTEVVIGKLVNVPIVGWAAALPIWCAYDGEKLHKWPLPTPAVVEDEFNGSLFTPPKEVKPQLKRKVTHNAQIETCDSPLPVDLDGTELRRDPFPSLEIKHGPGSLPEKRYAE